MKRLALSALLAASLARADFSAAKWQFRNQVHVRDRNLLAAVHIERSVYARTRQDLGDVRLVGGGQEVPYVIETLSGSVSEKELHPAMLNRGVRPGVGVQLTLDLGQSARHSRLGLATGEKNFRQRVRIEASDDGRVWLIAREDGYIFDFSQPERTISVLTIDYPVTTRRYLRVTVFGWNRAEAVRGAAVYYREERPAEWDIVGAVAPERSEDTKTQSSLLVFDLGQKGIPHGRIRLEPGGGDFYRAVELESSDRREDWRPLAQGVLYRIGTEQSLTLAYSERHTRYVRLRILNGDNQPVPVNRAYVETVRRNVKFVPGAAVDLWLYYGNPNARPPRYDLAAILDAQAPKGETPPAVGEWQDNPDYRPPAPPVKPWSERYPALLYGALGVAVVGMGVVTVRFLMKVKGAS